MNVFEPSNDKLEASPVQTDRDTNSIGFCARQLHAHALVIDRFFLESTIIIIYKSPSHLIIKV